MSHILIITLYKYWTDIKNNCLEIQNIIILALRMFRLPCQIIRFIRYAYDLTSCNIGSELDTNSRHESYL